MVDAKSEDVDGWSWTNDPIVKRIMLHGDGEWTEEIPQTERVLCSYDVNVDSKNNAWGRVSGLSIRLDDGRQDNGGNVLRDT